MVFGLKLNALRIADHPLLTVEAEDVLDVVDEIELAELSSCGSTSASEASDVFEFVRSRFCGAANEVGVAPSRQSPDGVEIVSFLKMTSLRLGAGRQGAVEDGRPIPFSFRW